MLCPAGFVLAISVCFSPAVGFCISPILYFLASYCCFSPFPICFHQLFLAVLRYDMPWCSLFQLLYAEAVIRRFDFVSYFDRSDFAVVFRCAMIVLLFPYVLCSVGCLLEDFSVAEYCVSALILYAALARVAYTKLRKL